MSRTAKRLAVSALCLSTLGAALAACSSGEDADNPFAGAECNPVELETIDPDLGSDEVRERIGDMLAVARTNGASEDELVALVSVAYAETKFGGADIPDADEYDIFSQRIDSGLDGDPVESGKRMLDRIMEASEADLSPGEVAYKAVRPPKRDRYTSVEDTAREIIITVGGC